LAPCNHSVLIRPAIALAAVCVSASLALAAASSVPTGYEPDPGLRTASRAELESRVRRSCMVVQARLRNVAETSVSRPCGCYATRTLRALDAAELDAYRTTGVFNDSARAKALAALDACQLQRPI
jgi:hypothetical protein